LVVSGLVFLVLGVEFGATWAAVCILSIVLSPFCLAGVAVLPPVLLDVSVNADEPLLPDELFPHADKPSIKDTPMAKKTLFIALISF
jgi:hypothetical protein